jgi:hypothetical protein
MTVSRDLSNLAPGVNTSGVLGVGRGGTGLTTLTAANNAIYSTSASALTAGTLPVAAGGTGSATFTANNVLLGNGTSALQAVAPGTSGNALISNGTTWASSSVPGGWVFLSTVTASAAATADIETTFNSTYDNYVIVANGVFTGTTTTLQARFRISGVWPTTNYSYSLLSNSTTTVAGTGNTVNTGSGVQITPNLTTSSTNTINFIFYVYNPSSITVVKNCSFNGYGSTAGQQFTGGGLYNATTALTGVRFLGASGTITGTFRLYGIKNS